MLTAFAMYAALGAVVGILAGLLGIGGGLIIVPMLLLAFSYQGIPPELSMHMAVGTSLASILFTSFSSAWAHHRHGGVNWTIIKYISPGIIFGTFFGSFLASRISTEYLQLFFMAFIFYVAWQILKGKSPKPSRHMPGVFGTSLFGGVIGLLSSLMGIGGGVLSVPLLILHNLEIRQAIGTSAAISLPIALAGSLGYFVNGLGLSNLPPYSAGFIFLPAVAGIVIFSVPLAPYGARLAQALPIPLIKKGFAIFLMGLGLRMLWQAV